MTVLNDVNHLVAVLRDTLDLPGLDLNGDGQAEVVFAEGFSGYLTRLDGDAVELSFRLPEIDAADPAALRAMLVANCLGQGTGPGRLAVDAGRDEALYCERWSARDLDAERVDARLTAFLQAGAFWMTEGLDLLEAEAAKAKPRAEAAAAPAGDEVYIRI